MKKTSIIVTALATLTALAATATWHPYAASVDESVAAPTSLKVESIEEHTVTLSWISPEAVEGYWDDFESHPDFAINSPGTIGWQYIDGDNRSTYTWNAGTFPGQGSKMAFMVMNGGEMSLADGLDMSTNTNFQPVSGKKMLLDFCSIGAANNDYIISPELAFDEPFHISFMARSYTVSYGAERVRVGYSTTGCRQSDFTFVTTRATDNGTLAPIQGHDYLELPAAWTLISYDIPAEARYVCVNCVSNDAFMFMLDDLYVGPNNVRPDRTPTQAAVRNRLLGFNIYRNGERINSELYPSEVFTDVVPEYGSYAYTVTAVYADGSESAPSEALSVEVSDVTLLPFEDDFTVYFLDESKWTTPDDAYGNQSRWGVGYYEYGLVNQSAVYSYSALHSYDHSLVSREMRTLQPNNTWLRYTLQHVCYQFEGVDYLDVEVKGLNESEWHQVASHTNENGSFARTVFQYPIGKLLRNAEEGRFQLRFRAHGADAQYIDYWYLDDVKVWNPLWSSATLTVTDGSSPLANISIGLTGDNGSNYNVQTDASGVASLKQIEEGSYRLSVLAEGYNAYETTLVVTSEPAVLDITLNSPRLELSATSIAASDMTTEATTQHRFTITNTGTGPAHWSLDRQLDKGSGSVEHRFEQGPVFTLSGDLQSSIVFDGEYFYTSSWYFLGRFYKYDREGRFLEEFSIPEMYYMVYDFAFDGRYVYASDYSNRIFQLDMDERRIVSVIDIPELPDLKITHLAYDPDRDGFWCGTFNTLVLVDRLGKQLAMEMQWDFSAYGTAYDNITPGGPYLWVADMTMPDDVIIDKVMLRQFNLTSRSYTGLSHVVNDMPGYRNGSETNGQNQVCGLTITDKLVPGQMTLVGTLQQSPSLVYTYNVCTLDPWLSVSPMRGTLEAGESQEIVVDLSSRYASVGECKSTELTLATNPVTPSLTVDVAMQVTHVTDCPRPRQLTAAVHQAEVQLDWQDNDEVIRYDVYRNDRLCRSLSETSMVDSNLVFGSYIYKVRALYANGMSQFSDPVAVEVRQGAPYYAPVGVVASIDNNHDVTLSWQSPLVNVGKDCTLMWGTGENRDQLGAGSGYFYAGQQWKAEELVPYRNKTITSVNVRICAPVSYLAARVYQDGKLVARTVFGGKVTYGEFTSIELSRPVNIVPGSDYIVAVQVMSDDGLRPLGMDDDTHYDGKGNLISLDGTTWYTAAQAAIEGNFNLSFTAVGSDEELQEAAPLGYDVWRDGESLGTCDGFTTIWNDRVDEPGMHTYTVTSRYANGESPASEPVSVRVLDICNRRAPQPVQVNLVRNRLMNLNWAPASSATMAGAEYTFPVDLHTANHTHRNGYPEYLLSWQTVGTEMGVACDGQYVYTTIFNESGRINVYTLEGQYLGKVVIRDPNLGGIRNLAWDGNSLWAADNSTMIHRLSLQVNATADGYDITGAVEASYSISEYSRHLAYIPDMNQGEGGFEVGDWGTSILVTTTGAKQGSGPVYNAAAGTAYYDGCIYAFEQNNPLNGHCVAVYDWQTHHMLRVIDLEQYAELSGIEECYAGGASTFRTSDGMTVLALCLQSGTQPSRLVFLDLSGSEGVMGYNVYRDGELLADNQPARSFADTLTQMGQYCYQVSTRYLDGSESDLSEPVVASVVDPGLADVPASVQAMADVYPYNVTLSFADPHLFEGVAMSEDFEQGVVGQPFASGKWTNLGEAWAVTDRHYHGSQAVMAAGEAEAWLVMPVVDGCTSLDFVACCEAVAGVMGQLEVYYSLDGDRVEDFILLDGYVTLPRWQQFTVALPQGVDYVILRKPAECASAQFVDAVRLHTDDPQSSVYGYQIFRDGQLITPDPVLDITYTDHNLAQGKYRYQVRQVSVLSAESALSEPVTVDLDYDNGGQPPVNVCAEVLNADTHPSVQLTWDAPALGTDVHLAWHNGRNHDAAGLQKGGAYWAAVRWAPSDLVGYEALSVSEVEVYVNQVPEAMYIMLYEGSELRCQQMVERPQQYAFNRIALREPLPVNPQKELRLVVYVEHNEITIPLGYDEGPCIADGKSNIYSSDGITWTRLSDEATGIDANWNFGLVLRPYALANAEAQSRARSRAAMVLAATGESSLNALLGYRVYVNRQGQNEAPFQPTSYIDEVVRPGIPYLEYQVKAVYNKHGEVSAPILRIQNPMQRETSEQSRDLDPIETIASDSTDVPCYNLQGQRTYLRSGITIRGGDVEWTQ